MRTYLYALLVILVLLIAHDLGLAYGLYLSVWPYDIFTHMLGGLGIGFCLAAILGTHGTAIVHKRRAVLIGVLVAGILWEAFEAYYNIAGYPVGTKLYWIDTIKDLFDDMLGGTIAAYCVFK